MVQRTHLIILFVFTVLVAACTTLQEPVARPERDSGPLARIRLDPYLKMQATVTATVAGHTGTFLFDTGEGTSSISPDFAKTIGCRPWGRMTGFRMNGERLDSSHCDYLVFTLDDQSFVANTAIVLDIMEFMGPDVPHLDGAIGLDMFYGHAITILPRKELIVESDASLATRVAHARELPVRLVLDAEGVSVSIDGAVPTPAGIAWFELDSGNGGSLVVANHIAPLLGLPVDAGTPIQSGFSLANGIRVEGKIRTRDLIMDGNIGAQFLNQWALTLDLRHNRAWLAPCSQ
jgi:hypothetical protein